MHIEPGEDPRETAVREVKEETGQWARVRDWIDDIRFLEDAESPLVRVFLMELVEDAGVWVEAKRAVSKVRSKNVVNWRPENRQSKWLRIADPKLEAAFQETRTLLDVLGLRHAGINECNRLISSVDDL